MNIKAEQQFPTAKIKQQVLSYLYKTRSISKSSSTECIFKLFVSENGKLIIHNPREYMGNYSFSKTTNHKDDFEVLASQCRESWILNNEEENCINLTAEEIDENISNIECNKLNDTLEEIEFLLTQGEKNSDRQKSVSKIPIFKKPNIREETTPKAQKPNFIKPVTKMSSVKKQNYDYILSPVCALIHKSANTPQIIKPKTRMKDDINVPSKAVASISTNNKKSDDPFIKNTTYKRAKHEIIHSAQNIQYPSNIEKHMQTPNTMKIHHTASKRVKVVEDDDLLKDEDITLRSNNTTTNISFVTTKKLY